MTDEVSLTTIKRMAHVVEKHAADFGLPLSNKTASATEISYRVWGSKLRVEDFEPLLAMLNTKVAQRFRWYQSKHGMGKHLAGDAEYHRNLGLGKHVAVRIEVLYTGSIMLRFVIPQEAAS